MRLTGITITGPDDRTDYVFLKEMTVKYPFVEWGILMSSTRKGSPRYPSLGWIAGLIEYFTGPDWERVHQNFSAHVCGSLCTKVVDGMAQSFYQDDYLGGSALRSIFSRIQLNGYPDHLYDTKKLIALANSVSDEFSIILPIPNYTIRNRSLDHWPSNMHFLHDPSRGRGVEPDGWPVPYFEHVGYAGGLNQDNMKKHLDLLCGWEDHRNSIWVDLETGARTDDVLDEAKVEKILQIAGEYIQ